MGSDASAGELATAAVALHHANGAVESLLSRVARVLGEGLPEGADWHQALLHAASLEIEEVRPAWLCGASEETLQRLLGFRHFFRHACAVALDPRKLRDLRDDLVRHRERIFQDLSGLDRFLADLAARSSD